MPKERGTYVITASVFVDDVYSPEEAAAIVEDVNQKEQYGIGPTLQVRLPDPDSEHKWEKVGD